LAAEILLQEVRPKEIAGTINPVEVQEIIFDRGPSDGKAIAKFDPKYCNIELALARAMHACGMADIIAKMYRDNDDNEAIVNKPVCLGGPFVSDDALLRRLEIDSSLGTCILRVLPL
jgi:hypothetical protein